MTDYATYRDIITQNPDNIVDIIPLDARHEVVNHYGFDSGKWLTGCIRKKDGVFISRITYEAVKPPHRPIYDFKIREGSLDYA